MNICVFDKYFSTLGGGERHIGVVIELLLHKHSVTIIHSGEFRREDVSKKLNLDLSRASFVDIGGYEDEADAVNQIVAQEKADIFINATHFSGLTIDGIVNVSMVFFPKYIYPKAITFKEKMKYVLARKLFGEYTRKIGFEKFSYEEHIHGSLGRWSSSRSVLHINTPFNDVEIYYENFQNAIIKDIVKQIRLHGNLNFYIDKEKIYFNYRQPGPAKLVMDFHAFVPAELFPGNADKRELGLFITRVYTDSFSRFTKFVLWLWRKPLTKNLLNRLYIKGNCLGEQIQYGEFLKKNTLLLSNSKYTSGWINRIYGKGIKPHILYPPTMTSNPLYAKDNKKNYIISVGRFFTGDHSKKQLELIKFFKKMYDTCPAARNYTFHVCGGTHNEERNQQYLQLCYQSSQGYPIQIHPNIRFEDLRELYAESKIFWHGAGLYEDPLNFPDRFEHLGFTTIEAMLSGCVPVVIGVAGQLEVVDNGINGFLWQHGDELIEKTNRVMMDEALRKKLSAGAIKRADDFNYAHFEKNVKETFLKINVEI